MFSRNAVYFPIRLLACGSFGHFLFLKDVSGSNWFITFLYQMLLETNHFISYFRTTHKSDDLSSVFFIISVPKEFGLDWEDIK